MTGMALCGAGEIIFSSISRSTARLSPWPVSSDLYIEPDTSRMQPTTVGPVEVAIIMKQWVRLYIPIWLEETEVGDHS